MTVYVIDETRPLPPTKGDNEHALVLGNYDTVILASGSEIGASGYGACGLATGLQANLIIDGEVHSVQSTAIGMLGSLRIGATGGVYGLEYGVFMGDDFEHGTTNFLNNAGRIWGGGAGIYLDGQRDVIINSGEIIGGTGIYFYGGYDPAQSLVVTNSGLIKGTDSWAIYGAFYGPNIISNTGTIEGDVILGYGNDLYDGRGGTVTGEVNLTHGDDVAYGGNGSETFAVMAGTKFIDGGAGIDTLRFHYAANVDLKITDKQQINGNIRDTIRNIENLIGGNGSDSFKGNDVANVFTSGYGHDTLEGNGGDDILVGGAGNDLLSGGSGSDIAVYSGRYADYTFGEDASHALTIKDNRASSDGVDTLTGIEFALFADRIVTLSTSRPPASSTETGPFVPPSDPSIPPTEAQVAPRSLVLNGGKKADRLVGGSGDDRLNGGLGKDVLTGKAGDDTFIFSTKLGAKNVDLVRDFSHADDQFQLSSKIFSKIERGVLNKGAFVVANKALADDDRIIFNAKTGAVSYDADGSGTDFAAIKFAQVKAGTLLKAGDFFIV